MKKSIASVLNEKSALRAFLIHFLIGAAAFAPALIMNGGLFSLAGDFNSQQIPFTMHAQDVIRSGAAGFDFGIDLGSGFIGSMAFYVLGTPSFWLSMLIPPRYLMYAIGWFYVLKYAVAGLTSYVYIARFVRQPRSALLGSMFYAFSGFMNTNLLFYHFHDVVMLFPLLLITLDDLTEKKRRGLFALAVFLNAVVNYYFLIGEVIFLIIYYFLKYYDPGFRTCRRSIGRVLFEGILGGVLGMALLWPAFLFVIQNPRVKMDYTGSNSLVFSGQRYLFILKGLLFPGEVQSHHTAVLDRNFASCAAYLPMCGILPVAAYLYGHGKSRLGRMLKICMACAAIPILNAVFSAFAGLYCRWYYIPVLFMSLAAAEAFDEAMQPGEPVPEDVRRRFHYAFFLSMGLLIFFVVFITLVKWNNEGTSLLYRPYLFAVFALAAAAGFGITWYCVCFRRKNRFLVLFICAAIFAAVTTGGTVISYYCEHGRPSSDLLDIFRTSESFHTEDAYRFASEDNEIMLAHGYPASGSFCSTVSGSIFRLYEALGLKRDVKSPDPPDGFYTLISARYSIDTVRKEDEGNVSSAKEGTVDSGEAPAPEDTRSLIGVYEGKYRTYYEYEDPSVPAIGFTYDTYMTASEFEKTDKKIRAVYMLKSLVVADEDEELVKDVLRHAAPAEANKPAAADAALYGQKHQAEMSYYVEKNRDGLLSRIRTDGKKYVFYSIPDDDGWKAYVDGTETAILDVCGFMAVCVPEGDHEILFRYTTPGLKAGIAASCAGAAVLLIYLLVCLILGRGSRRGRRSPGRSYDEEE